MLYNINDISYKGTKKPMFVRRRTNFRSYINV